MSRVPFEQMIASLRPPSSSSPKSGTIAGEVPVPVPAPVLVVVMVSLRLYRLYKNDSSTRAPRSDTALGLGQTGDVGHLLCGLLGEEPEELLGRDAADHGDPPDGGGLSLLLVVLAQEPDRLPVLLGQWLDADLRGEPARQLIIPLVVLGEETLGVDVDLFGADRADGHRPAS